jgi:hypothetical protein
MSVGAGTSYGQIVRQTRKYFRYQSGKGIQTSCGINFKPSIDIESMTKFSTQLLNVRLVALTVLLTTCLLRLVKQKILMEM